MGDPASGQDGTGFKYRAAQRRAMPDSLARELGRKSATTSARNTVIAVLVVAIFAALLLGVVDPSPLLVAAVALLVVAIAAVTSAVEIVEAYERRALTVLGDYRRLLDPGVHLVPPFVSRAYRFDLRTQTFDVPRQEAITRDNSPVTADAVVYIKVMDAKRAFLEVEDYKRATSNLAQTTLRAAIGDMELNATLSDRSRINERIRRELEGPTDEWGIRVEAVEVREVNPSQSVQSAMEQQIAAERRRRAMILEAQGERRSAVERAQGDKQATIIEAQGEKQSRILEAQGEAISTVLGAKSAESMGERAVLERGMESLAEIGTSPSTTYVLPQELTSLLGRYGKHLSGSDADGGGPTLESLEFDGETRELLGVDDIDDLAAGNGDADGEFTMETADIERDAADE
jgi:regulator of protease activity HflC (stomatin/prohibitin superfamily)